MIYKVDSEDTIEKIANKLEIKNTVIMSLNDIPDDDNLPEVL